MIEVLNWIFASWDHFLGVAVLLYCLSPKISTEVKNYTKDKKL